VTIPVRMPLKCSSWPVTPDGHPSTLVAAVARNAAESGSNIAVRERKFGIWRERDWAAVLSEVLAMAAGLEELGLKEGSALTVIGDNRPRLYFAMLAAGVLRAFPVPVFPDVSANELATYTLHGLPTMAVAEDQEQVDKLIELREQIGRPTTIIYDDDRGLGTYTGAGIVSFDSVVASGLRRLAAEPGLASELIGRAGPDDIAVLLHSSGTTGTPKGIPLRHRNILGGVANAAAAGYFGDNEELFAYLPTAWVGDFVFTLGAGLFLRSTINIPERQETALHDLREVAPTFYLAAPRAWDSMLTRVQVGMADSTPLKRRLFNIFMPKAIALERKRLAGGKPTVFERLVHAVGNLFVYGPVRDFLGLSRAERAFTGGEAIGEDTFLFFRALGVKLKQFYGQTETCALTAAQTEGHVKLHTVGPPMSGVDVRIAESGEILVRSVSVIDGYFGGDADADNAIVVGWLHTGDAGYLDPDGELIVLGRVSEVVRTAAGERYIPNFIENRIKFSAYVRNVAVIGADRPDLTAIVCIDLEGVGHWAEKRGISSTSYADLSQKPAVLDLVASVLAHVNQTQPAGLRIKRFINLHKDFDADDGEITRTRKLRRNVVETNYDELIRALYADASSAKSVMFDAQIAYESGEKGVIRRSLSINQVGA
jgi:long-chain acyl-CoA synthetase